MQERIVCNCCGQELQKLDDVHYVDHIHIIKRWGYFSEQDGVVEEYHICPTCFEKQKESFVIPTTKKWATELL